MISTRVHRRSHPNVLRSRNGFLRRRVRARLDRLEQGRIVVHEGPQRLVLGRTEAENASCEVTIHAPRFYRRLAFGGTIGAAESYIDGDWSTNDLPALLRILARDTACQWDLEGGAARAGQFLARLWHRLRDNSRRGSRRNIANHYDLSNDFFATFLDPTLTYSCAVFESPESSLEEASVRKLDLVCRKLDLRPGMELLEIGTGWGSLAIHAARRYGCRVVTTTISRAQFDLASERIHDAGLGDRVRVLDVDYRDLPARLGQRFDRLVSIEMIEAVGHRRLGEYFATCEKLLHPAGTMLLQAIVIADRFHERYRRSVDFIQRYVFPGGCLPSLTSICRAVSTSSDLQVVDVEDLTPHYVTTLRRWRENFRANRARLDALSVPASARRLFEFYFAYCEAGFAERVVGDLHVVLARPQAALRIVTRERA